MGGPLLHVVLFEPEKAGNVGNVARTCAVLGAELHLIRPFGFHLHDREFRRAVMDYLQGVTLHEHAGWTAFRPLWPRTRGSSRLPPTPRRCTRGPDSSAATTCALAPNRAGCRCGCVRACPR